MELRHLKYFIAVAEELNFGRAAMRLHLSQPPLTRQIRQLEEELGVELFVRTNKGVALTAAGTALLQDAYGMLALAERAAEKAQMAARGELGRIDIGMYGAAVFNVIPRLLLTFREVYPAVDIVLHTMTKHEQIKALREGRLNIAINRLFPNEPDMVIETVLRERMLIAGHQGHWVAEMDAVSIVDLAGEPLILFPNVGRPSLADEVISLCRAAGFQPRVVQETGDVVSAVALASIGFGLTVVPESTRNLQLPGLVYRPLEDPTPIIDLSCMYHRDDDSPLLGALLNIIRTFRWE